MEAVTSTPPSKIVRLKKEARAAKRASAHKLRFGNLLYIFWLIAAGIGIYVLFQIFTKRQTIESVVSALFIIVSALLPLYYWATGRARGMPLFPIYSLTFIWTFALPLLGNQPIIAQFAPEEQFYASITVSAFLLVGGVIWYLLAKRPTPQRTHCLAARSALGDELFLALVIFGLVFTVSSGAGWLRLEPGVYAIVRAVALAFEALGCFVLSYRMGAGKLSWPIKVSFLVAAVCLFCATLPGLLLVNAMSIFAVVILGYTLASARFPWRSTVLIILLFAFLHGGKSEMRVRHWTEGDLKPVQPWEYPAFIGEWLDVSWEHLFHPDPMEEGQTLLQRASLIQLLLYVQHATPADIPYMYGATYAVIPGLFVPRIFYPDKPRSHEGTYLLNIHYGFQTREDTETTTIGFGLLNESYANFGLLGVGLLAVVTGLVYGGVTLLARGVPVLSYRALFAILVTSYSFQSEFSASVYVSALFQSTVALSGFALFFMQPRRMDPARDTLLP